MSISKRQGWQHQNRINEYYTHESFSQKSSVSFHFKETDLSSRLKHETGLHGQVEKQIIVMAFLHRFLQWLIRWMAFTNDSSLSNVSITAPVNEISKEYGDAINQSVQSLSHFSGESSVFQFALKLLEASTTVSFFLEMRVFAFPCAMSLPSQSGVKLFQRNKRKSSTNNQM